MIKSRSLALIRHWVEWVQSFHKWKIILLWFEIMICNVSSVAFFARGPTPSNEKCFRQTFLLLFSLLPPFFCEAFSICVILTSWEQRWDKISSAVEWLTISYKWAVQWNKKLGLSWCTGTRGNSYCFQFVNVSFLCVPVKEDTTKKFVKNCEELKRIARIKICRITCSCHRL